MANSRIDSAAGTRVSLVSNDIEPFVGDLFFSLSSQTRSYRGRDARYRAPPAQIPAGAIRAPGSHLGCLTAKRTLGQG